MATPIERILREAGGKDLLDTLASRLAPTDLQTLLLKVFSDRASKVTPSRLLEQYEENRFVRPASVSPVELLEFDRLAFSLATPAFEPIELAPVCPLGISSALSDVSQNNVVATIRNTEVVSDSTNCMALECAIRRRALLRTGAKPERVRLCSSHRLVRAQSFSGPATFAHFKVFALCTAGRDQGSFRFEQETLSEHVGFYLDLLNACGAGQALVEVSDFSEPPKTMGLEEFLPELMTKYPDATFRLYPDRVRGRGYYEGLCFQIGLMMADGTPFDIADGGFTTWTQKLLSNRKERLLISGIGSERLCAIRKSAAMA